MNSTHQPPATAERIVAKIRETEWRYDEDYGYGHYPTINAELSSVATREMDIGTVVNCENASSSTAWTVLRTPRSDMSNQQHSSTGEPIEALSVVPGSAVLKNRKSTCLRCRAFDGHTRCTLGFEVRSVKTFYGQFLRAPAEPCPRPITVKQFIEAAGWDSSPNNQGVARPLSRPATSA